MILTSNTLYEISKHTNKTLKLADFMVKAGNQIHFSKLSTLSDESTEIELIEAFHDDLNKTTKKLVDIHQLLSTVNEDGVVLHLKGEKQLSKIFGDAYSKENQTIEFPFGTFDLKKEVDRDELKEKILEKTTGLTTEEYGLMHSGRKVIFKHHANELHSLDDKIEFLASYASREMFEDAIDKIKGLISGNINFRKALSVEERSLIDEEITFERSMLDSVTKASLYLTKDGGIEQWGSGFKSQKEKTNEVLKELKDHPYIEAFELTSGTSLDAAKSLLKEIEILNLNLPQKLILKSRKLGNYNANGIYIHAFNTLAIDVASPSPVIHELVHAIDAHNPDIRKSKVRYDLAQRMRARMPNKQKLISEYGSSLADKYWSTTEIIARAGEMTYLFEKYDYKPENESFEDFTDRVKKEQLQKHAFDLRIEPAIEDRIIKKADIFFNPKELNAQDVKELRSFYKSFFTLSKGQSLRKIHSVELKEQKAHIVVNRSPRFEKTALSFVNEKNIKALMDNNEKTKVVDPNEIITEIFEKSTEVGRTKKKLSNKEVHAQSLTFKELSDWAYENKNFYAMSRMIEQMYKIHNESSYMNVGLYDFAKNNTDFTLKMDCNEEVKTLEKMVAPIFETKDQFSKEDVEEYDNAVKQTVLKPLHELREYSKKSKLFDELTDKHRQSGNLHDTSLNEVGFSNRFSHVLKMFQATLNRDGDEIFNYFGKDDLAPTLSVIQPVESYKTLQSYVLRNYRQENYSRELLTETLNHNGFLSVLKENNQLEELIDISKRVDVKYSYTANNMKSSYSNISSYNYMDIQNKAANGFSLQYMEHLNVLKKYKNDEEEIKLEDLVLKTKVLPKYEEVQKEIKQLKSGFTQTVDSEILKEDDPLTQFVEASKKIKTSVPDDISDGVEQDNKKVQKSNMDKKLIELSKEDDLTDTPIDPNPKIEEPIKKRGRKRKVDPNQRSLF